MRYFVTLVFCLSVFEGAVAGTHLPISLTNDAEAKISIDSCFSDLPFCGYAPIEVYISNDSARVQRWRFYFQSPMYLFGSMNSMVFGADLEVQSKSARTFKLLVPLASGEPESYSNPLAVSVSGPWSNMGSRQQFVHRNRSGKPMSAFVAMSDSLASRCWSQIEKELDGKKVDLAGTRFVPNELPDDWRALVGVAGLWITGEELRSLASGQRAALRDWVCRGGSLFICGAAEHDMQVATGGFGTVSLLPTESVDVDQTVSAIGELERTSLQHHLNQSYGSDWKAAAAFGKIKMNLPLLIGFMALFAVVAGPMNLFVFAGRARRYRLFWTTPVISVAASVLLLLLIILQDGFGGSGLRVALVYISPAEKRDVHLQEQIARTGVVLSSSFQTRDSCFIAPIALGTSRTAPKRKYQNSETSFGGQWFVSRTLQPHWIESVATSRAGVILANEAEMGRTKAAPIIVSNMTVLLDQLYFRDENGQGWSARNIHTGQRVTLQSEAEMPELLPAEAGARLRTMWERVKEKKSYFYAISRDSASLVATLPSIRWTDDRVIYVGPLSNPAP